MKLFNKEYLQGFDAKSIKRIAHHEFGLALSKTIDGKRKEFTKAELIEMILATQTEQAETVTNEIAPETIATEKEVITLSLNEVVKFAVQKVKAIKTLNELHNFKKKLLTTLESKKQSKKRTFKKEWSLQYNRLQMLFKQAERKLHA